MKTKFLPAIALAATMTTLLAFAAEQQAKDPNKRVGTREELRACMNDQPQIQARQEALRARGQELGEMAKKIQAETEDVKQDQKRLDSDDSLTGLARTRIERRVREHNAKLKDAREVEVKFDQDKAQFDKDLLAWRERCVNVQFMQDDLDEIKKERDAAGKK